MARIVMLIPAALNAGAQTISLGLLGALTKKNIRTTVLPEFELEVLETFLITKKLDTFLENLFEQYKTAATNQDIVIISGISLAKPYATELNSTIATAIGAAVVFITAPEQNIPAAMQQLKILIDPYQNRHKHQILGFIVNKAAPPDSLLIEQYKNSLDIDIPLLGIIPYKNELAEKTRIAIDQYLNLSWVWPFLNNIVEQAVTPTMFRHGLIATAKRANKKIVLPSGDEPRILQAANICAARGIAHCVLLGKKSAIYNTCDKINLKLNEQIEIIEPHNVFEKYIEPLCEARRKKGLTPDEARNQLESNIVLGIMMLHVGEVDGLVAGVVHTTADTVRPALQIIKTAANVKLVSSVFFMCLPNQVLVYGDCAINLNPTSEGLADIAIQSADSAAAFGIIPRIAMLSYSTGNSGSGIDVDKVKQATELVKQLRPDLEIDGPLQYDAAIDQKIAKLKLPDSKVAGKATVFIAPDLEVGNIVYKAVQRSTGIVCIGPMLQGLRKPVNDLSRGSTIEDIVFTIAVTAVQATQQQ